MSESKECDCILCQIKEDTGLEVNRTMTPLVLCLNITNRFSNGTTRTGDVGFVGWIDESCNRWIFEAQGPFDYERRIDVAMEDIDNQDASTLRRIISCVVDKEKARYTVNSMRVIDKEEEYNKLFMKYGNESYTYDVETHKKIKETVEFEKE